MFSQSQAFNCFLSPNCPSSRSFLAVLRPITTVRTLIRMSILGDYCTSHKSRGNGILLRQASVYCFHCQPYLSVGVWPTDVTSFQISIIAFFVALTEKVYWSSHRKGLGSFLFPSQLVVQYLHVLAMWPNLQQCLPTVV